MFYSKSNSYFTFLSTTPSECYIHFQLHVLLVTFSLCIYTIKKATYVGIVMLYYIISGTPVYLALSSNCTVMLLTHL